ncbi:MAG: hypothetical protein HYZ30_01320 [Candidatus Azosocius agrarius]|nr:MAG: hypothetical protein HYZ30_01320 [Gammaproteobacteria bacterium]
MFIVKFIVIALLIILFLIMIIYIFFKNKEYYNVCSKLPFINEDSFKEK